MFGLPSRFSFEFSWAQVERLPICWILQISCPVSEPVGSSEQSTQVVRSWVASQQVTGWWLSHQSFRIVWHLLGLGWNQISRTYCFMRSRKLIWKIRSDAVRLAECCCKLVNHRRLANNWLLIFAAELCHYVLTWYAKSSSYRSCRFVFPMGVTSFYVAIALINWWLWYRFEPCHPLSRRIVRAKCSQECQEIINKASKAVRCVGAASMAAALLLTSATQVSL